MDLYEPHIRTRLTDIGATIFTNQKRENRCRDFELQFKYCMEAYGKPVGDTKCKDMHDDLTECVLHTKQYKRIDAMRMERDRQYAAGERKEYAGPIPKPDSY